MDFKKLDKLFKYSAIAFLGYSYFQIHLSINPYQLFDQIQIMINSGESLKQVSMEKVRPQLKLLELNKKIKCEIDYLPYNEIKQYQETRKAGILMLNLRGDESKEELFNLIRGQIRRFTPYYFYQDYDQLLDYLDRKLDQYTWNHISNEAEGFLTPKGFIRIFIMPIKGQEWWNFVQQKPRIPVFILKFGEKQKQKSKDVLDFINWISSRDIHLIIINKQD